VDGLAVTTGSDADGDAPCETDSACKSVGEALELAVPVMLDEALRTWVDDGDAACVGVRVAVGETVDDAVDDMEGEELSDDVIDALCI
jgi:hypothetical protein